jgi:regulator of cell morphogenesis and NO signaling
VISTNEKTDWTTAPLTELVDYIIANHHVFLRNELPALRSRIAKVIDAHGDSLVPLRETYQALLQGLEALEADLHAHIHLENNILFPRASGLEQRLQS